VFWWSSWDGLTGFGIHQYTIDMLDWRLGSIDARLETIVQHGMSIIVTFIEFSKGHSFIYPRTRMCLISVLRYGAHPAFHCPPALSKVVGQ